MPGLIESKRYTEAKASLCAQDDSGAEDALDALEWRLININALDEFTLITGVDPTRTTSYPIRCVVVPASTFTPALVAVFTVELFGVEEKILLLDVWVPDMGSE